jgi:hypothetical protein
MSGKKKKKKSKSTVSSSSIATAATSGDEHAVASVREGSLQLWWSSTRGHHWRASSDIKAGTLLLVETPAITSQPFQWSQTINSTTPSNAPTIDSSPTTSASPPTDNIHQPLHGAPSTSIGTVARALLSHQFLSKYLTSSSSSNNTIQNDSKDSINSEVPDGYTMEQWARALSQVRLNGVVVRIESKQQKPSNRPENDKEATPSSVTTSSSSSSSSSSLGVLVLFQRFPFFNHSCWPNADVCYTMAAHRTYSIADIRKGTCQSYSIWLLLLIFNVLSCKVKRYVYHIVGVCYYYHYHYDKHHYNQAGASLVHVNDVAYLTFVSTTVILMRINIMHMSQRIPNEKLHLIHSSIAF